MTFRRHHHLLSHLILQHHHTPRFSFSEQFSSQKAFSRVKSHTREQVISSLQAQLSEARSLLVRLRGSLDYEQYTSLIQKIGLLEEKIKEKRKKLDLTGPLP